MSNNYIAAKCILLRKYLSRTNVCLLCGLIVFRIRTPMNGVMGMAELLSLTNLSTEQSELVESIHISAQYLLTVINDVLDYS